MKATASTLLLNKLLQECDNLSATDERLLEALIAQLGHKRLTMQALAHKAGSSPATVSRLATKLGFTGYQELCVVLAQRYQQLEQALLPAHSPAIQYYQQDILNKVRFTQTSIQQFTQEIDLNQLHKVLHLLHKAKHIIVLATGFSALLGQYLVYQLLQLGKDALLVDILMPNESFQHLLQHNDLVITISKSAQTSVLQRRMQDVQIATITNILLTSNPSGHLRQWASLFIELPDLTQVIQPNLNSLFQLKMTFLIDLLISWLADKEKIPLH